LPNGFREINSRWGFARRREKKAGWNNPNSRCALGLFAKTTGTKQAKRVGSAGTKGKKDLVL